MSKKSKKQQEPQIPEGETIEQFATRTGKSVQWIRRLIRRQLIPATLVGRPISPVPYYVIPFGTEVPTLPQGRPRKTAPPVPTTKPPQHAARKSARKP